MKKGRKTNSIARPDIIEIVTRASSIKTWPGCMWHETPKYFRLWDAFGPMAQPLAKEKIIQVITKGQQL